MSGILGPKILIPGAANNMTGTSVITSAVLVIRTLSCAAIQAVWTGTPTGTFSIQGSLDYNPDAMSNGLPLSAGTWRDIGVSLTAPSGSASDALADIALSGIPYIRVVYTNASGNGTLTVTGFAKGA